MNIKFISGTISTFTISLAIALALLLPTSIKKAEATTQPNNNVACSISGVPLRPIKGTTIQPKITVTNKTSDKIGSVKFSVSLKANGKTSSYSINTGSVNKNSKITQSLQPVYIPYRVNNIYAANYTAQSVNPAISCKVDFTLPKQPSTSTTVYSYKNETMNSWLLSTYPKLNSAEYNNWNIENGKTFEAFKTQLPDTKPVHALNDTQSYSNDYSLNYYAVTYCEKPTCYDLGTVFYAYEEQKPNTVPVYKIYRTYGPPYGPAADKLRNQYYTTDFNEVIEATKTGWFFITAFYVPR